MTTGSYMGMISIELISVDSETVHKIASLELPLTLGRTDCILVFFTYLMLNRFWYSFMIRPKKLRRVKMQLFWILNRIRVEDYLYVDGFIRN